MTGPDDEKPTLFSDLAGQSLQDWVPLRVVFEITYKCNLSCDFCYRTGQPREELTTVEACDIISSLRAEGCMFLTLTGGEILCRPDFWDIAEFARHERLALELKTNGVLVDAAAAERIAGLMPLNVDISLYGARASVHDAMTGTHGSFEAAVNAIRLLTERGVRVTVKCLLTRENFSEHAGVKALAAELGADCMFDLTVTAEQGGCTSPHVHRASDEQLADFISGYLAEYLDSLGETPQPGDFLEAQDCVQCQAALTTCCINPYGDLFPCVQFLRKAGNLREESFHRTWRESAELARIRQIRLRDLKACGECELLPYCMRCPGLAELEDGDVLGPSSEACRQARLCREIVNGARPDRT